MRALVIVMCVTVGAGVAAADGKYGGVGFGSGTLSGTLAEKFDADGQVAGRIIGGARSGPLAVEGVFFGTDLAARGQPVGNKYSTLSLGVDFKVYLPLADALEGYLRGGLNHTWLTALTGSDNDSGRSYDYGLGLQYSFRQLRVVQAALWLDYNHQVLRLTGSDRPGDGDLRMLTLGFSVGTAL